MRKVRLYKTPHKNYYTKRRMHARGMLLLALLSIFPLVKPNIISNFMHIATTSEAPKDFGKLKFVSNVGQVTLRGNPVLFKCPFSGGVLEFNKNGEAVIRGNTDLFKAVMPGVVESVKTQGKQKFITISHGDGIKSIYEFEGLFCVKNNDMVDGNYIGMSFKKSVTITITKAAKVLKITAINNDILDVDL